LPGRATNTNNNVAFSAEPTELSPGGKRREGLCLYPVMRSSSPGTNRCLWVAAPVLPDLMSFILLAKNCDLSVAFNLERP
jgi:hypothetical protein